MYLDIETFKCFNFGLNWISGNNTCSNEVSPEVQILGAEKLQKAIEWVAIGLCMVLHPCQCQHGHMV